MAPTAFTFTPADLAPGDVKATALDLTGLQFHRVASLEDPFFEVAYVPLSAQFGAAHEVESREILRQRLARNAAPIRDGFAMRYDLLLVRSGGKYAAVRDHTAIADASGAVVHLSHLLIAPEWRRSGLAGWLRALPIQTARAALQAVGACGDAPITLVAEMEYPDGHDDARAIRLKAYERAGFLKIDPVAVHFHQPDFRPPDVIDASGGPVPLPFQLIVRRVGCEEEDVISGAETRAIVERLYRMYARDFRPEDMRPVWQQLENYPAPDASIALIPPSA